MNWVLDQLGYLGYATLSLKAERLERKVGKMIQ